MIGVLTAALQVATPACVIDAARLFESVSVQTGGGRGGGEQPFGTETVVEYV